MMESPLEGTHVVLSTSGNEQNGTGGVDQSYAPEQGRNLGTSTSTHKESGMESNELDEEPELLTPTSEKEERTTDGGHDNEEKSKEEKSNSDTDKTSDSDAETSADQIQDDDGDSSEVSSIENVHQGFHAKMEEGEKDRKPNLKEELIKAPADEDSSAASVDMAMVPESVKMEGLILGNNAETPISISQEEYQRDVNSSLESLKVPTRDESESSSSQVRVMTDVGPDLLEFGEHASENLMKAKDDYVKKGFTCDANTEEEDEELREYWTRALQTSTSTGEIVEEIVKVLKHHQKTHDLLCPVCGSCVTRRVILRKRKRSSFISVDRWYRDPLDEGEVQEQEGALPEVSEAQAEDLITEEYQDVEAFGCMSCFSLFFQKGRQLMTQFQDMGSDTLNCLPFFFPPYPWGMTQIKSRSTDSQAEVSVLGVAEDTPLLDVQDAPSMDIRPDFTCGIGSTLLPDYPWGTTHILSKGNFLDQTQIAEDAGSSMEDVEQQREDIAGSPHGLNEERTCSCGLAPSILPAYPWGVCKKHTKGLEDAGTISQSVDNSQPLVNESTCTCGIAEALFPHYQWSYFTKVEEVATKPPSVVEAGPEDASHSVPEDASRSVPEDANLQGLSQPEISEEAPELVREERSCTCGLLPALLPEYAWGLTKNYKGADTVEDKTDMQAKAVQETEGKVAQDTNFSCDITSALLPDYQWGMTSESQDTPEDAQNQRRRSLQNDAHMHIGSAILPSYPWGKCSVHQSIHEPNGRVQPHHDAADRDCTCGMGFTVLPEYPWGQTVPTAGNKPAADPIVSSQEVKNYIEQETKIEARITSKTDVYTVTSTKTTYPGEKPPESIKTMIPHETSQTVEHVRLDQTVTVINASVKVDEAAGINGPPLASLPSTGYALLDSVEGGLGGSERLQSRPSTGYAHLKELTEEQEPPIPEIVEDPASIKHTHPKINVKSTWQPVPQESYDKHENAKPQTASSGTQFPSFEWSVGKVNAGDLATTLLQASLEPKSETFISVLDPRPVSVHEPKSGNLLSIFKVPKPSDEGGLTTPLLSPPSAYVEEIQEVKGSVSRPQIQGVGDGVIDVPPSDLGGTSVGTTSATAIAVADKKKKETGDWDILKSIVFGGLDISIASLGVTSSAAGGNAITRTVVYMGLATLVSGLIGFYHNVLNLYHYHKNHYIDVVGLTLMLHGTVALISYVVFGALSPLVYALSYRATDDRDDKFILCCGVTIVAVTLLALGKAKVSNKRYLRTLFAYLLGGVLAAIIGYLTGEHVAELLEEWGI